MQQMELIPGPTSVSVVYYATDLRNIKIGTTINPKRRGGELRSFMLLTIPGGELEESRQHRMWDRYRIGASEWFCPGDDLMLWLAVQLMVPGRGRELAVLRKVILDNKRAAA